MEWKVLKKIADPDSIITEPNSKGSEVVRVRFKINGSLVTGQFDPDNIGVYGISVEGSDLLSLLKLDENGDAITAPTGVDENDS